MDFLKTEAPFWKREHRNDGSPNPKARESWVAAKAGDDAAKARWRDG